MLEKEQVRRFSILSRPKRKPNQEPYDNTLATRTSQTTDQDKLYSTTVFSNNHVLGACFSTLAYGLSAATTAAQRYM